MDIETRKALIERYLEADTSLKEEKQLHDWYTTHPSNEDERDFSLLIGLSAPYRHCLLGIDSVEAEFDQILAAGKKKRNSRIIRWTAVIGAVCAAAAALLLWLIPTRPTSDSPLTPIQIAESIQQMTLLDVGDIESIVATPSVSSVILTAFLKDGNTCSFVLTCDNDEGITSLLAYPNN